MLVATILGWLMVQWAHLTGVASEDDTLLWSSTPDMQLTGVVICAIIITAVGVLNDVTITQASAVWELSGSDADESRLFSRAMRIGRDHIASSTYTIAFCRHRRLPGDLPDDDRLQPAAAGGDRHGGVQHGDHLHPGRRPGGDPGDAADHRDQGGRRQRQSGPSR